MKRLQLCALVLLGTPPGQNNLEINPLSKPAGGIKNSIGKNRSE
jgi:hypothetical protein